jgi:hypothetical protein
MVAGGHLIDFDGMVCETQMFVRYANKRLRLWITFLLTVFSARRHGSKPYDIFSFHISH